MGAIGLNPIRLDRIGLDPIRINAIRLGVPGAASGSDRPYIDPEVLASLKAVCICYGKSNDDPDRAIVKNLVDPDNPFIISNAAYTEGSGYADKDSPYYGAFVTDGVDDLITSTKTVQEMLGGSNEITVVSLITHISGTGKYNIIGNGGIQVSDYSGQTFMAGTSSAGEKIVELGDKEKLQAVQYTNFDSKLTIGLEDSSYAYYGTFVFNKENVPVDWIHQVIAYYNLDRCVEPTVLYDVKRQGLSNDTPDSDWYLKDFSKNGFDMSLFNFAKKGNSGVGKYNFSSINPLSNRFEGTVTSNKCHFTKKLVSDTSNFCDLLVISPNEPIKFKVSGLSDGRKLFILNKSGSGSNYNFDNGEYEVSLSFSEGVGQNNPFGVTGDIGDIDVTVEFIPSHAGALCLDGVEDYGKVTGLPIYKDYTFIIDYERISYTSEGWGGAIVSKSPSANNGAFISMMANSAGLNKQLFSFGGVTAFIKDDLSRILFWQTKYKSENTELTVGEGVDGDTLWLGTLRDNDLRFFNGAIYSLMSFPYSLSEFLIERQLKKHKLGTLYPDMVELRPIVNSNVKYQDIIFRNTSTGEDLVAGQYYDLGTISIFIKPLGCDEATAVKVNNVNAEFNSYDKNSGYYRFDSVVTKSPQKIDITIYQPPQYLTILNNETLISNETLIKNE